MSRETFQLSGKYLCVILIDLSYTFSGYTTGYADCGCLVVNFRYSDLDIIFTTFCNSWWPGGEEKSVLPDMLVFDSLQSFFRFGLGFIRSGNGFLFSQRKIKRQKKKQSSSNYYYIGFGDNQTIFGASFRNAIL